MSEVTSNIDYEKVISVSNYIVTFFEQYGKQPSIELISSACNIPVDEVQNHIDNISYENDMVYYKSKANQVINNLLALTEKYPVACEKYLQLIGWKPNQEQGTGNQIIFKTYV